MIRRAIFPSDLENVLEIYREYIASTNADLSFQENEKEFLYLDEKYSNERSQIFLAYSSSQVIGCAAFREYTQDICELKRLYVRPVGRGVGVGAELLEKTIQVSKSIGYKRMCLDVLPEFQIALNLYKNRGFVKHHPITTNEIHGTEFLSFDL